MVNKRAVQDVNAAEGQIDRPSRFHRHNFLPSLNVFPATQTHIILIKHKIARSLPLAHSQGDISARVYMVGQHLPQVDGGEDVHIIKG